MTELLIAIKNEFSSGRVSADVYASVFRLLAGLFLAILIGTPAGLWLGHMASLRLFLGTPLNFLRSISPLAWIPFAVIWFGLGDPPVIFLVFVGCFFPWVFATALAVQSVPRVYMSVARDHGFSSREILLDVVLPAIAPRLLQTCRLIATLGWIVLVPAEMLAGREGLGFAIMDARNGMRVDLLILNIFVIGSLAHSTDSLLARVQRSPFLRWGHER